MNDPAAAGAAAGGDLEVAWGGERLRLAVEGAALWESGPGRPLLVADTHFGKTATLRARSVAVPPGVTGGDLERLGRLVTRTGTRRLIVLGDFLHAREGRAPATLAALAAWRERHGDLDILLVRGNHDRRAGDPPAGLGIRCVDGPWIEGPFAWRHEPEPVAGSRVVAGHLHPAVVLVGPGQQRERLPCFVFGETVAVLPAFGGLTGAARIRPRTGDRVFLLAGDRVVEARTQTG